MPTSRLIAGMARSYNLVRRQFGLFEEISSSKNSRNVITFVLPL